MNYGSHVADTTQNIKMMKNTEPMQKPGVHPHACDGCFGSVLTQLRYKLDYLLSYNTDICRQRGMWHKSNDNSRLIIYRVYNHTQTTAVQVFV
jgi:hypothetical protein